jgi:hypothetical protein
VIDLPDCLVTNQFSLETSRRERLIEQVMFFFCFWGEVGAIVFEIF